MKQLVCAIMLLILFKATNSNAQIYSPQLIGHNGLRTIFYPLGYYQGNVINGVANGMGTFYWRDGSFFQGSFANGFYHGSGIVVSRYGYIAGCWNGGAFMGPCQNISNPYNNNTAAQQAIVSVQQNRPDDPNFPGVSPEGYQITRIDPNSQMGQSMLGRRTAND